jgi:hypothetical protein
MTTSVEDTLKELNQTMGPNYICKRGDKYLTITYKEKLKVDHSTLANLKMRKSEQLLGGYHSKNDIFIACVLVKKETTFNVYKFEASLQILNIGYSIETGENIKFPQLKKDFEYFINDTKETIEDHKVHASLIRKAELKNQLEEMGIRVEGNYIRKKDIIESFYNLFP